MIAANSRIMSFPLPPAGTGSSVLDRVKMFLPQIEKANKELEEQVKSEGANSVQIDAHLGQTESGAQEGGAGAAGVEEIGEDTVFKGLSAAVAEAETTAEGTEREVQLEFALGDFDETPIAKMEAAKEQQQEDEDEEDED